MNITDFAQSRGEQPQTIRMYMSRHQELFEGHTTRNGKSVELDEEAIKILEEQYPLPEMVQIIRDPELEKELEWTRQQLNHTMTENSDLKSRIIEMTGIAARAEANQMMLEDKENQLAQTRERLDKTEEKLEKKDEILEQMRAELEAARRETEDAKREAEALKNRGLFARIFNKNV